MTVPQPGSPDYTSATVQKKTMSVTSLVLGIVGVVFAFLFSIVGVIAGIIAVVFGFLGRSRESFARGYWLTGLILGFVAIVLGIIFAVLGAIMAAHILQNAGR